MVKCKKCGREFRTRQGLGSHIGHVHKKKEAALEASPAPPDATKPAQAEVLAIPAEQAVVETREPASAAPDAAAGEVAVVPQPEAEDMSKAERIRNYLAMGYTFDQLTKTFNFPDSSVYQEMEKVVAPEGKSEDANKDAGLPVTTKGTEIITPEAIMQRLANGSQDWHLRLEGMMLLRAAQRMNRDDIEMTRMQAEADATRIKPILDLMRETRLEQDSAAQRAKESNIEIAERAAYDTAGQLSQVISQNNARITDSISQIRQAMGGKEENPLGQVLNAMQSMQQMMQMFGVSMPGMPGAQGGGPAPQWQPMPIKHSKRNETQGGAEDARPDAADDGHPAGP